MTLQEFRRNPACVGYAETLFASKRFKELLEAVRGEHPKNYRLLRVGLPESDHSVMLGRVFGFDEFDNNLMSAAQPLAPEASPPPATFGVKITEPDGD